MKKDYLLLKISMGWMAGIAIFFFFESCSGSGEKTFWDEQALMEMGDGYATAAQSRLIGALLGQIEQEGIVSAISYCHSNAESLTAVDSLQEKGIIVSRVAQRNRNDGNALDKEDAIVFGLMKSKAKMVEGEERMLREEEEDIIFYKAIFLGMPTCLKCHGKEEEITEEVMFEIDNLYPNDIARDFSLGDLRGMWKVRIPKRELTAFQTERGQ
jgi:hypothetical protein